MELDPAIDRRDFVPEEYKDQADQDRPLPIGHGMTTSQPSTIAFMLEKLDARPGQRVLEIGTGSGYMTALLAKLVGKQGRVYSIEHIPELATFAKNNLKKYHFRNIKIKTGDGKLGWPATAPFDRIIASAEATEVPQPWNNQLTTGGILVTPHRGRMLKLVKTSPTEFTEEYFSYFSFVGLR